MLLAYWELRVPEPEDGRLVIRVDGRARDRREGRLSALCCSVMLLACGGGLDPIPQADAIAKVATTDNQTTPAGTRLPVALAVRATFSDGAPAPRTEIVWSILEGAGAQLSDTLSLSDGVGTAEVSLIVGAPGIYRVRAAINIDRTQAVTFTATAVDGPSITAVEPTTFAAYDTLVVRGTGLSVESIVEIGDTPARTLPGTADSLLAIVPPCLMPGSLDVVVVAGGARSNAVPATYTSSTDTIRLEVGEFRTLTPQSLSRCATFPGTGPGGEAEYVFAAQSASTILGDLVSFRLQSGSPPTPGPGPVAQPSETVPLDVQFHDWLRARDREHSELPKPGPVLRAAAVASVEVGDRRGFRVCSVLTCQDPEDFPSVDAEARYVGDHAIIYVDRDAPGSGLSSQQITELGQLFDEELYEVASAAFGVESDIDRNGRTVILMTPKVNGLTPLTDCADAIITGFFFSIDVDPAFANDSRSNQGEVFYAVTADPAGSEGCRISVDKLREIVPVTFIHELQHMVSYNQHVLVRQGAIEQTWLNEAMSHFAEELGGRHLLASGDTASFSRFVRGDLVNAYQFLRDAGANYLLFDDGTGTLRERGGGWLFVRWLVDQYGPGVIRRLSETGTVGVQNVEDAVGESWDRLVTRWFMSNFMTDHPDVTVAPTLEYSSWDFRTAFEALHLADPSRFPSPFPIVPPVWLGGNGSVTGTLLAGSGQFVQVVLLGNDDGFVIDFTGFDGEPFTTGAPRMSVVRIK